MGSGVPKSPKQSKSGNPHTVDASGSPKRGGDPHTPSSEFRSPRQSGDPMRPAVPSGSPDPQAPPRNTPREPRTTKKGV